MPLVTTKEIEIILRRGGFGLLSSALSQSLMRVLRIHDINTLYDRYSHLEAIPFIDALLRELDIHVFMSGISKGRLSISGPAIVVANHPLGGIDGLLLLRVLLEERSDVKIISNFILNRITPLRHHFCAVNPFEMKRSAGDSVAGFRDALLHLKNGGILVVFPAGQVSTPAARWSGPLVDKEWELPAIKLIQRAMVPVIPVYIEAKNSPFFYTMSAMHDTLRTAALPGELFRSRGKTVKIHAGKQIAPFQWVHLESPGDVRYFLRKETYQLAPAVARKTVSRTVRAIKKVPVARPQPFEQVVNEISALQIQGKCLLQSGMYQLYFTGLDMQSSLLKEIGRLRELTFRAVGEGTNNATDIDAFDEYYHHLILWDKSCQQIAGAYRLGLGHQIWKEKGMKGFYLSSQFHISGPVADMFSKGIEMGRAFIRQDYQTRPFPLFLLWKGIAQIAERYPACRYLMGAVSISSSYSALSQSCMVHFLQSYCSNHQLNQYVLPVNPFRHDATFLKFQKAQSLPQNMAELEKLIRTIEPNGLKMPVLIKKYLARNAKFLGFNVDVHFNNSIDGLMYLDLESFDSTFLQR